MDQALVSTLDHQLRDCSIAFRLWDLFLASPPEYFTDGQRWFYKDYSGRYHQMTERNLESRLVAFGLSRKRFDEHPTECEMATTYLQDRHAVVYTGQLAGYSTGIHTLRDGSRVLLVGETRPVAPKSGQWPLLESIFKGLLHGEGIDQTPYFFGWLKVFLEAYLATLDRGITSQSPMGGHAVVLCGPANSGKSLVKHIITEMFGGLSASPYAYMLGQTTFNQDIAEAPILAVDDEAASKDPRDRNRLAAEIKQLVASGARRIHPKYQKAITLTPCQRLIICVNDEPQNMLVLPVIDQSVEDKLFLFKVQQAQMPMPTDTVEGRNALWDALVKELPAFAYYLLQEFTIPEELRSGRFGVKHFHHPDLIASIKELDTDEDQVLEMIDELFMRDHFSVAYDVKQKTDLGNDDLRQGRKEPWRGSAAQLLEILQSRFKDRNLKLIFKYGNSAGTILGSLAKAFPDRVERGTTVRGAQRWVLFPPPEGDASRS